MISITTFSQYVRHQLLPNLWYKPSPPLLFYILLPFSWIYQLIASTKRWLYISGHRKQVRFSVPIIVVGNITVGGTGKTPLIIALAHLLSAHGYRPGIVSRGYGGKPSTLPLHVTPQTSPLEAGDEPVLIAEKTRCPVVVSPKRVAAIDALLNTYNCNVILSDDGMQHYQMHRDIEIAVIDGQRRFGNGHCLPAGPLRETIRRLKNVDFVISQGEATENEYSMQLIPDAIYSLNDPTKILDLAEAQKKPVHAVAGIGHPDRFFNQLKSMGFSIIPHPFPDHHAYQPKDITFNDDYLVIMTEKDAIKCKTFSCKTFGATNRYPLDLKELGRPQSHETHEHSGFYVRMSNGDENDPRTSKATGIYWCLPVSAQCTETFFIHLLEKLQETVLHLGKQGSVIF